MCKIEADAPSAGIRILNVFVVKEYNYSIKQNKPPDIPPKK